MLSFHVKFVQTDRQTDRTTVKQYAPSIFRNGGIKRKLSTMCFQHREGKKWKYTYNQLLTIRYDAKDKPYDVTVSQVVS